MACAESLTDESTHSGNGQKRNSMSQSVSTHRTVSNEKPYELLTYDDIPEWYQDNRHIRGGYRPVSNSTQACLHSWFHLHNESVNIYSHLVPAVLFLFGVLYVLEPLHLRYENVAAGDYAVVAFFLLSATACFSLSAFYHTFISHSQKVEAQWLKLDFLGIILLIMGSFFANVYVTFWCEEKQQNIYWGMIGGLGAVSMIIICSPYFQGLRWRTFRLLTFVCTGLSGIAPMAHGLEMFGFSKMVHQAGLPFFLAAGSLFLVSCVIYGTRFPEQFWPGVFDIFGSSHQIFHSVVVIATVVHLAGVMSALDYNLRNRQCAWALVIRP